MGLNSSTSQYCKNTLELSKGEGTKHRRIWIETLSRDSKYRKMHSKNIVTKWWEQKNHFPIKPQYHEKTAKHLTISNLSNKWWTHYIINPKSLVRTEHPTKQHKHRYNAPIQRWNQWVYVKSK